MLVSQAEINRQGYAIHPDHLSKEVNVYLEEIMGIGLDDHASKTQLDEAHSEVETRYRRAYEIYRDTGKRDPLIRGLILPENLADDTINSGSIYSRLKDADRNSTTTREMQS